MSFALWLSFISMHAVVLADSHAAAVDAALPTSSSDVQVLTTLHQRRLQLDAREEEMNEREKALDAFKATLDKKLKAISVELDKFEARYALGEPARQEREKRIKALVDAMTGLSAKKAAPLLAAADPQLVGDLLIRMGPSRTAGLLAIMPVPKAARLMEQMGGPARPQETLAEDSSEATAAPSPAASATPAATDDKKTP